MGFPLWLVGAGLSIVGSICSNLGVNIQKYSFMKNEKLPKGLQRPYVKQPLWALGLSMVILGSLGDFAALGLAAQSIVAPIGATTLVANVLFAHYWLGEELSRRDMVGTFLIIAGSALAVSFGDHETRTYTMGDLKNLYIQLGFIIYAGVVVILATILYTIVKRLEPTKLALVDAIRRYEAARSEENDKAMEEEDGVIAELEQKYAKYEKLHPFSYCALSGMFGAQSILFGKMVAEMLGKTFRGDNQMIYPLTYVFLAAMLCSIFTQLHFLAVALSFFDALYVVPVFQCFFISVSTIGGAAYFQEFASFNIVQTFMFPAGLFLTLYGVYLLSARDMTSFDREVDDCIRNSPTAALTQHMLPSDHVSNLPGNLIVKIGGQGPSDLEMSTSLNPSRHGSRKNTDDPLIAPVPVVQHTVNGNRKSRNSTRSGKNSPTAGNRSPAARRSRKSSWAAEQDARAIVAARRASQGVFDFKSIRRRSFTTDGQLVESGPTRKLSALKPTFTTVRGGVFNVMPQPTRMALELNSPVSPRTSNQASAAESRVDVLSPYQEHSNDEDEDAK